MQGGTLSTGVYSNSSNSARKKVTSNYWSHYVNDCQSVNGYRTVRKHAAAGAGRSLRGCAAYCTVHIDAFRQVLVLVFVFIYVSTFIPWLNHK